MSSTNSSEQNEKNVSVWNRVPAAEADSVFGLVHLFLADPSPNKTLLGVGSYRTSEGKPFVLESVRMAEEKLALMKLDKEYLFPDGIPSYREKALELGYGENNILLKQRRVASAQTVAGTGALQLGFQFLKKFMPPTKKNIYVCKPTWSLHHSIIKSAGFDYEEMRYYDWQTKGFDFSGFIEDLSKIEDESIVLLQTSCHNPTGVDPTHEQWLEILEVLKEKQHFIFFDSAYQGFSTTNVLEDNYVIDLFSQNYDKFMLSQSFSKNFGLYGERAGCLSIVCTSEEEKAIMQTQFKAIILPQYAAPPSNGARIVDCILRDEELKNVWQQEVAGMGQRIRDLRVAIVQKLKELGNVHDWSHITNQIGMYAFTGLKESMIQEMRQSYSIYMPFDGRISIAGINPKNIDHICMAIHQVTTLEEI